MPEVKCICLKCGAEFFRYPSNIANGEGKYCSRKCLYSDRSRFPSPKRNGENIPCKECEKLFYISPSRQKMNRGKYCSKRCMLESFKKMTGNLNGHYKGETHTFKSKNGNRENLFVRDKNGIFKPEYRVIAERVLGRPLTSNEKVHHIDVDSNNNKNTNLLICDNSYHSWLHQRYAKRFAELHLTEAR